MATAEAVVPLQLPSWEKTFALGERPALGRYHQANNTQGHSGGAAGGFPNTLKLWTVRKVFTSATELTARCGPCLLHLSSLAVTINFFKSKSHHHGPAKSSSISQTTPSRTPHWWHVFVWPRTQVGVTHSPSLLQCRMQMHKASPQCPQSFEILPLSAFLRYSSQSKCRMSRDSNHPIPRAVRPWSLACLVESSLWVQF